MARTRRRQPRSFARSLGLLLLVNIIPLGVLAVLAVQYARGEIVIHEIPAGVTQTLIVVGVILVALILIASLCLPAAHDGVKALEGSLRRGRAVLAGQEEGSRVLVILAWPFLFLLHVLGSLARFVLILLSLLLIVLLFLFLARLQWPDLLQEQIDQVLAMSGGG